MSLRSAVSRADLLHTLRLTGAHKGETAAACGFVAVEKPARLPLQPVLRKGEDFSSGGTVISEPEPVAVPEFPKDLPRLTFLMPVQAKTLEPPPERRAEELPPGISDARLALRHGAPPLPLRPLVRWARLAPFLKRVLGRTVPGAAIDHRRLAREAGRGLPLTTLPRLARRVWCGQALVLRDDTMEMAPFRRDASWLLQRLRRERGRAGLREKRILGPPAASLLAGLPADAPVLALSCMGQYAGAEKQQAAWCGLARRMEWRGHSFHALVPVPRRCQVAPVAAVWPLAVWDSGARLPRHTARRGPLPPQDRSAAAERLMDLLSPATFVEAPLLRAVRRLVCGADAESEWAAWHHPLHWAAPDAFGFIHPENWEEAAALHAQRLARRRHLPAAETAEVNALIVRQHEAHSEAIAEEARLRYLLSGPADAAQLQSVRDFFGEVLQRLRVLATEPGSRAGQHSGLAAWFLRMVPRVPPEVRAAPAVAEVIARGLAAAYVFLETENAAVPAGIHTASFADEVHAAAGRFRESREYRLDLLGDQWAAQWALVPSGQRPEENTVPLSLLHVSSRSVMVAAESRDFLHHVGSAGESIALPVLTAPAVMAVDCGCERLHLEAKERPWWACRMQYDRRGLTAFVDLNGLRVPLRWLMGDDPAWDSTEWPMLDGGPAVRTGAWVAEQHLPWGRLFADEHGPAVTFNIEQAVFTVRWIPSGTFLMGSPDDEPGRSVYEGPRHSVRLSRGFWMGDSPVTQEQWRAVIEAAPQRCPTLWKELGKKRQPSASPSHFRGHGDLPVENVRWQESADFCRLLAALLPGGPGFALPTEAQWEYSCRAGTETALTSGPINILGEHNAPSLDPIAWYGGNSGGDLHVENPENSRRQDQQYPHPTAGTHQVKGKQPNTWGLFDTLGNVWEWCRDAWDEDAYRKRGPLTLDPVVPGKDGAPRVVRGGSWNDRARGCRAAFRYGFLPGGRWHALGLRLSAVQEPVRGIVAGEEGQSPEITDMTTTVSLNPSELKALFRIPKSDRGKGGFQGLIVKIQEQTNAETGVTQLKPEDLVRIQNYAFRGSGGYQSRIRAIFARSLGAKLDGNVNPK